MRGWLVALALGAALGGGVADAQDRPLQIVRGPEWSDAPGGAARACFQANFAFASADDLARRRGDARVEDFVVLQPQSDVAVSVQGRELCVSGLPRRVRHQLTLLAGLPGGADYALSQDRVFVLEAPARQARLGFRGDGYVLPKGAREGVPITSVNVSEAALRAYFLPARNLSAAASQGLLHETLYQWRADMLADRDGELVWDGALELDGPQDADHVSLIPLADVLPDESRAGVYVLAAREMDAQPYAPFATQWLLVTDLGVSTMQGADGLTVFVRSLDDGRPQRDVKLTLVARNNSVLAEARTDRTGLARFDRGVTRGEGGRSPALLFAERAGADFAFVELERPALDLSDRGAAGRLRPGPVDAFLYAERNLYRPGETAHVTALIRDSDARALDDAPVTLRVVRPDQQVAREFVLEPERAGAVSAEITFPRGGMTGAWRVDAHLDPEAEPIGSLAIQVRDFAPPTVEWRVTESPKQIRPGAPFTLKGQADFYYGAPAGDLVVQAEAMLTPALDAFSDAHPGFLFGDAANPAPPRRFDLANGRTDAAGSVTIDGTWDGLGAAAGPFDATFRLTANEPGGRPLNAVTRARAIPFDRFVGVRPLMEEAPWSEGLFRTRRGEEAAFQIVATTSTGEAVSAKGVAWRLVRERRNYLWYYESDRWRARAQITDQVLETGTLDLEAAPARFARLIDRWGQYRLEVSDPETKARAAVRFYVGYAPRLSEDDRPDQVDVTVNAEAPKVGQTVSVTVRPPFEADVLVAVATDRILETRYVPAGPDGVDVRFRAGESWGPGAHILATAFRRGDADEALGPSRAVGLTWLPVDRSARQLSVGLEADDVARPETVTDVTVTVRGGKVGKGAYVTLAAVEEGALALMGYETPDPFAHYFGRRALGIDLRDFYGRMIAPAADAVLGRVRTGGDAPEMALMSARAMSSRGARGAPDEGLKVVSLFSGFVETDSDGRAVVPLTLPDFNGRLRIMAIAWTEDSYGASERDLTVRAPLVAELARPRFLAPGDEAELAVSLRNVDAPEGAYEAALTLAGPVEVFGAATIAARLREGDEIRDAFKIRAAGVGVADLKLALTGPDGFRLERAFRLPVRAPEAPIERRSLTQLAAGSETALSADALAGFVEGTGEAAFTVSARPPLDVDGLVRSLARYPYGCVEQTISSAFPLAYLPRLEENWGLASGLGDVRGRVQNAIYSVIDRQRYDGTFGLWSVRSAPNTWLTAYAADFLLSMRDLGFDVPGAALANSLGRLENGAIRNLVSGGATWREADAYGLYVLARAGRAHAGQARYFAEQFGGELATPAARAHLAGALALLGDRDRAEALFTAAAEDRRPTNWRWYDYGSDARDRALIAALMLETGLDDAPLFDALLEATARGLETQRYHSTQTKAWMVRMAAGLEGGAALQARIDGAPVDGSRTTITREGVAWEDVMVANEGGRAIWLMTAAGGVPRAPSPSAQEGFRITRNWFDLDGAPADFREVRQGDTLIAVLDVDDRNVGTNETLVVDLLPAGFEIENAVLGGRGMDTIAWLPDLATRGALQVHEERRDDRYVASVQTRGASMRFAYAVRAVTPGDYVVPAPYVEDMYAPNLFGRGETSRVVIRPNR